MNLSELTTQEKIVEALEYRADANEQKYKDAYLEALRSNDEQRISEFEKHGKNVRQCCMNLYAYEKHREFGWFDFKPDEYGWLRNPEFLDTETVEFRHRKDGLWSANSVSVGRGLNGVWTYGIQYYTMNGGGFFGLRVFGHQFKSKGESLTAGKQDLLRRLKSTMEVNDPHPHKDYIVSVIKMIEDSMKQRQLELF